MGLTKELLAKVVSCHLAWQEQKIWQKVNVLYGNNLWLFAKSLSPAGQARRWTFATDSKVTVKIGHGRQATDVDCLVDSGVSYTLLPENVWQKLKLTPIDEMKFVLADGTVIKRKLSEVWLEYEGKGRTTQVILGEKGDEALLGAMTLEAFGLVLNPFTRELAPMKLMLASHRRKQK